MPLPPPSGTSGRTSKTKAQLGKIRHRDVNDSGPRTPDAAKKKQKHAHVIQKHGEPVSSRSVTPPLSPPPPLPQSTPSSSSLGQTSGAVTDAPHTKKDSKRARDWHYSGASSRCLSCGQLTCTCTETFRLDPEEKRRKLERLRLNTPFERAKIQRITEECRAEEARLRARITEQWATRSGALLQLFAEETELAELATQERLQRRVLIKREKARRTALRVLEENGSVFVALSRHEEAARTAVTALERAAAETLSYTAAFLSEAAALHRREGLDRHTLSCAEGTERQRMAAREADGRRLMQSHAVARHAVFKACLDARAGTAAREVAAFGALVSRAAEERSLVSQRLAMLRQQRATVERAEGMRRDGVEEEERSARRALAAECESDVYEAREAEQLRLQRVEAEMRDALLTLHGIAHEEDSLFNAIRAAETRERAAVYDAMLAREEACAALVREACDGAATLAAEEAASFAQLMRDGAAAEMEVLERERARDRQAAELMAIAEAEKEDMRREEHSLRFQIISYKAEEEEEIRSWRARMREGLESLLLAEAEQRAAVEEQSVRAYEELAWAQRTEAEAVTAARQRRRGEREALWCACAQALERLAEQQSEEWEQLLSHFSSGQSVAEAETRWRERSTLMIAESAARTEVTGEEAVARGSLAAHMRSALRCLGAELASRLQARTVELAAEEGVARGDVEAAEAREAQQLAQAQEEEQRRLAAELRRRRQSDMTEDARLYDPTESLVFDACAAGAASPSSCRGWGGSESQLRRELVNQTLSLPPDVAATLADADVAFLHQVLEAIQTQRSKTHEANTAAAKAAKAVHAKLEQSERELAAERERRTAYRAKCERDTQDRTRRVEADKQEQLQKRRQLEMETERLNAALSHLEQQKTRLEKLKVAINKNYMR